MRRCLLLLLCVFAFSSLVTQPSQGQNLRPVDTNFMGMVVRDPHYEWKTNPRWNGANRDFYDTMLANLDTLGVRWIRIEMRAEDNIAYNPNDPYQGLRLAQYDYLIDKIATDYPHIKIIALLATNLARDTSYINPEEIERNDQEVSTYPQCLSYKYGCGTNKYMRIWLDRAFAIAKHYEGKVDAYEVMNEENRYINGAGKGISPVKMATLLTKFYRIFKSGGPDNSFGSWRNDVRILLGGIHPGRCDDCGSGGMNDRQYLNAIYQSDPFQNYTSGPGRYPLDGVAYHPYPMEMRGGLKPEPTAIYDLFRVPQRMEAMRKVMVDNGDTSNKIWVTEIGDRGDPSDLDNQARQADFMRSIYFMLWQRRAFIETVLWFKYEDFAVDPDTGESPENWGVVRLVPGRTAQCPTCEYTPDGTVETKKASYVTFFEFAHFDINTHKVYVPMVNK